MSNLPEMSITLSRAVQAELTAAGNILDEVEMYFLQGALEEEHVGESDATLIAIIKDFVKNSKNNPDNPVYKAPLN